MQCELDINYGECQVYSLQLESPGLVIRWGTSWSWPGTCWCKIYIPFLTFQTIIFPFFRYLLGEELCKKSKQI